MMMGPLLMFVGGGVGIVVEKVVGDHHCNSTDMMCSSFVEDKMVMAATTLYKVG